MRRFIAVFLMLFAVAAFAAAQENPKVEIFAGYSGFLFDDQGLEDSISAACPGCYSFTKALHGWEGAAQFNINKTFGIVADFSGHYGTPLEVIATGQSIDTTMYNVLFGPQVNLRGKRFAGYVHTLFGFNRVKVEQVPLTPIPEFTESGFAWAVGGGFDVNINKTVGIRVGQLDYILTDHDFGLPVSTGHQNNLRFSAGLIFRFGGTK